MGIFGTLIPRQVPRQECHNGRRVEDQKTIYKGIFIVKCILPINTSTFTFLQFAQLSKPKNYQYEPHRLLPRTLNLGFCRHLSCGAHA